ncbi:MAG: tetratricopeptide repeat protein [Sedimentisphaerales bacterium]|nr:tetratricopeptide repeat protein [Sedimentisphaerales bacterium]
MDKRRGCEVSSRGGKLKSNGTVVWLLLLALVVAIVLAAHWPVLSTQVLLFDDDQYLVENRFVQNPSFSSVKRFVTEVVAPSTVPGYYQPITMISLMLDVAAGGSANNLKQFRITSLCFHAANSILVIVFLYLLFGRILPAAMLGLLYGCHPVTIESIAWLSQRKALLAAFFALWSLISYLYYARKGLWRYYCISLLMYVLSLLSKPTMVGMPILMLLLDFWPARRLSRRAIFEKVPLFVIGGIFSVITFISQSTTSVVKLPTEGGSARILMIFCHNIVFYLRNFLWPANLSWYYPFPKPLGLSQPLVLIGIVGTCALIAALLISLRWSRGLLVGWLFFFAAILPTMGVVGVHPVIAADRHMYFAMIGLFLPIGWLMGFLWSGKDQKLSTGFRRATVIGCVVVLVISEFTLTRCYLVHWRDTEAIYKYMLKYSPDVAILHNNLANVLKDSGKINNAIEHYNKSLELKPGSAEVYNNLGNALGKLGRIEQSVECYKKALSIKPNFSAAHYNLGSALAQQGKTEQAIAEYLKALENRPDNTDILSSLGYAYARIERFDEAARYYRMVLQVEPGNAIAHGRLGLALAEQGKIEQAIEQFEWVLLARPEDLEMYCNLGILLERQGKTEEAIKAYRQALKISPGFERARKLLNTALKKTH